MHPEQYQEYPPSIKNSFSNDSIHSVYAELKALEAEIRVAAEDVIKKGVDAQKAQNNYDLVKNQMIVHMALEESTPEFKEKRTDLIRQSKYRDAYSTERMAAMLAKREYDVAVHYLDALQGNQRSIQTRSRLIATDFE